MKFIHSSQPTVTLSKSDYDALIDGYSKSTENAAKLVEKLAASLEPHDTRLAVILRRAAKEVFDTPATTGG